VDGYRKKPSTLKPRDEGTRSGWRQWNKNQKRKIEKKNKSERDIYTEKELII
jgi:hypothetical protein